MEYLTASSSSSSSLSSSGSPSSSSSSPHMTWQDGDSAAIFCQSTGDTWYLTCHGDNWVGHVGNCSEVASRDLSDVITISSGLTGCCDVPGVCRVCVFAEVWKF
ncbi:hypothetical protein HELRODRAFT_178294 [Helobdella robusta]|uniref:Uncharacterized protein n=1 Tax=Helobdella robusta TaxID=6412 RepID=T1FD18_HELRO|nr:hypothetical protein HELRODRAFT_178294 [Helobdella robusta]ESN97182.1 hypothetical protein HELRODRAFT_178294 [Helobdella robusta]